MTLHDLCMYSMNDFEKQVWDNLIADIKYRIFEADIPDVPLNIIEHQVDNNTAICIPYQRYKGYHRMEGFYDIAIGDRGGENELLLTKDGEKAKNHIVNSGFLMKIQWSFGITKEKIHQLLNYRSLFSIRFFLYTGD